jgi:hypothetical protein
MGQPLPSSGATSQELAASAPAGSSAAPHTSSGAAGAAGTGEQVPPAVAAPGGNCLSGHDFPPPGFVPGEWLPFSPQVPPGGELARVLLDGVKEVLAGSWRGVVTTPWTNPYVVDITFHADGHYSDRCSELEDACCSAFYYGTSDDTPLKQWRVDDATLSGNVFGELDVVFDYGDSHGLPAWQGELSQIERDASGNGLRFEFSHLTYGPQRFDLRRVQ